MSEDGAIGWFDNFLHFIRNYLPGAATALTVYLTTSMTAPMALGWLFGGGGILLIINSLRNLTKGWGSTNDGIIVNSARNNLSKCFTAGGIKVMKLKKTQNAISTTGRSQWNLGSIPPKRSEAGSDANTKAIEAIKDSFTESLNTFKNNYKNYIYTQILAYLFWYAKMGPTVKEFRAPSICESNLWELMEKIKSYNDDRVEKTQIEAVLGATTEFLSKPLVMDIQSWKEDLEKYDDCVESFFESSDQSARDNVITYLWSKILEKRSPQPPQAVNPDQASPKPQSDRDILLDLLTDLGASSQASSLSAASSQASSLSATSSPTPSLSTTSSPTPSLSTAPKLSQKAIIYLNKIFYTDDSCWKLQAQQTPQSVGEVKGFTEGKTMLNILCGKSKEFKQKTSESYSLVSAGINFNMMTTEWLASRIKAGQKRTADAAPKVAKVAPKAVPKAVNTIENQFEPVESEDEGILQSYESSSPANQKKMEKELLKFAKKSKQHQLYKLWLDLGFGYDPADDLMNNVVEQIINPPYVARFAGAKGFHESAELSKQYGGGSDADKNSIFTINPSSTDLVKKVGGLKKQLSVMDIIPIEIQKALLENDGSYDKKLGKRLTAYNNDKDKVLREVRKEKKAG